MDEKRRVNDEDVNLSDMINEYSQDNELRRKIEEMKKQKEEEKRLAQSYQASHANEGSIFDSITDTGTFKQPDTSTERKIPDIRVDEDDVTKTRINMDPKPAYDKTLVIMDNKTALDHKDSSALEDTMPLQMHNAQDTALFQKQDDAAYEEDHDAEDYEEEDDDDNLLARMKERKRQKEEAREEEDDEDDEESSAKVNKIITYVILGIVGIAIIVGAFFGVKYVLNNFLGGSDDKDKISDTKKEETPSKTTETNTQDDDEEKPSNKENIESNKAAAAQLNKQLDAYQGQLDDVNKQLAEQQKKLDEANKALDSYASLKNEAAEIQSVYTKLSSEEVALQKQIDAEGDADKKQVLQNQMEQLKEQHAETAANYGASDVAGLKALAEQKNFDYNTKSQAAEQKKSAAQTQVDTLTTRKTELEKNIASVTTKLNKYN